VERIKQVYEAKLQKLYRKREGNHLSSQSTDNGDHDQYYEAEVL
jgi:hypothetical protein